MTRSMDDDRRLLTRSLREGLPDRGGGRRAVAARAAFGRALWNSRGERRLPTGPELDRALRGLAPAELEWLCEFGPLGPVYFLPTTRWVDALARHIRSLGVQRVLEVGAGEGFLSRALARRAPDLTVQACDSGAWIKPQARMNARERRELRDTAVAGLTLGNNVWQCTASAAIKRYAPDMILAAWLPPTGTLLSRLIRSPVDYVLDVGAAGGVTPGAWHWRFAHEQCEGPLEQLARCRLDARPEKQLATRVTRYYGARHSEHHCEKVRPGDWLWQFRPAD